ncbi:hypothetical protein [Glaciimonas immobilis]|nr:hypothetical protein [Glaciimonas immobilis]KAF3998100.1 hypothetical protein HAV38_11155 [Glaciimonas immobilis]
MAILFVQMIGMAFHHHDLLKESAECASCDLAAHVPAPPSLLPIAVMVPILVFAYYLLQVRIYFSARVGAGYLKPHSHAPPFYLRDKRPSLFDAVWR